MNRYHLRRYRYALIGGDFKAPYSGWSPTSEMPCSAAVVVSVKGPTVVTIRVCAVSIVIVWIVVVTVIVRIVPAPPIRITVTADEHIMRGSVMAPVTTPVVSNKTAAVEIGTAKG